MANRIQHDFCQQTAKSTTFLAISATYEHAQPRTQSSEAIPPIGKAPQ